MNPSDQEQEAAKWWTIVASILSETLRPIRTGRGKVNMLSLEVAYYLTDAMAIIAPILHKRLVSLLPKILIMLDRHEAAYKILKMMDFRALNRTTVKAIRGGTTDMTFDESDTIIDNPIAKLNCRENVDLLMILDMVLIKITAAIGIRQLLVLQKMIPNFSRDRRKVLEKIGSYLGLPTAFGMVSPVALEKQCMDLLKFIHLHNHTILPSIVRRSRELIVTSRGPLAAKLSFHEWHRHEEALSFLKIVAEDLISMT